MDGNHQKSVRAMVSAPRNLGSLRSWSLLFIDILLLSTARSFLFAESQRRTKNNIYGLHSAPEGDDRNNVVKHNQSHRESETTLKELQSQLASQQRQINQLIKLWTQSQQHGSDKQKELPVVPLVPPLKAMLFIDGTWLYYSVHEREPWECPFIAKYGRGWQRSHDIDWNALPKVVNAHLTQAVRRFSNRPLEIVRSSVFTSYKANTGPSTYRYKLFEDLKKANYDVFMMETVGRSEKCVDIQLAVEMLHHATDSGASYDIAILLTGDKDFIPAIIRTRQKGKMFSLVSMKSGCNRALVDLPGIKDFDVLWLDDHLDELIYRKESVPLKALLPTTEYTILKVIHDFVEQSGFDKVSSRDLGRYLKRQRVGKDSFLESLKEAFGSLYHYLAADEAFILTHDDEKGDSNFWVSMAPAAPRRLVELREESKLSDAERQFFAVYSTQQLANKESTYSRTLLQDSLANDDADASELDSPPNADELSTEKRQNNSLVKYVSLDKTALRDACRGLGLKVSGTKAQLLERIQMHLKAESQAEVEPSPKPSQPRPTSLNDYLKGLSVEFLRANGGRVGSRDMGRYLAANRGKNGKTALADLKERYGSLFEFVSRANNEFATQPCIGDSKEFDIVLQR